VRDVGQAQVPVSFSGESPILYYSRYRDVRLIAPGRKASIRQSYNGGLLNEVVDKPFLQTVDAGLASGVREEYPFGPESIVPYTRMAYTNTGGEIVRQGYQLGIFLVKVAYEFRGRRG